MNNKNNSRQGRNWFFRHSRPKNSMLFILMTATFLVFLYSSIFYLAPSNRLLEEQSFSLALNGLLGTLSTAYPAARSAMDAGLNDSSILSLLGRPSEEDSISGAIMPFFAGADDFGIGEGSGLPDALAGEIEQAFRSDDFATHELASVHGSASVCRVQAGEKVWLAAIIELPGSGRYFGLARDITPVIARTKKVELSLAGSLAFANLVFFVLLLFVLRAVTSPLRVLTKAAERYGRGDFDFEVKVRTSMTEIGVLADSFTKMGSELREHHESLEAYSRMLEAANRKAANAVDKLSQRHREQQAIIEASLQANKLALPQEIIELLLTYLHNNLDLATTTYYLPTRNNGFKAEPFGDPLMSRTGMAPPHVVQAILKCFQAMEPLRITANPNPETSEADDGWASEMDDLKGERLYLPLPNGISKVGAVELIARPNCEFDEEIIQFCRHFVSHMEVILRNKTLYQETVRRTHELERINQISRAISGELDMDLLLRDVVENSQKTIRAECVFVGLLEAGRLQIRHVTPGVARIDQWTMEVEGDHYLTELIRHGRSVLINDLQQNASGVRNSFLLLNSFRSFVACPIKRKTLVLGVICGFSHRPDAFSSNDTYFLELLASQVAIALDNARMFEEILARDRRRDHQLMMAQKLQENRVPRYYKQDIAALSCRLRPADELAGDFCDVFSLGRHSMAIVIGDVANKGVAASLMTFSLLSMFRNVAKTLKPPCEIMETINRSLVGQIKEDGWFATAFYGRFNTKQRTFTYSSAGHEQPIWFHAETGLVEPLEAVGYPLGLFRNFPYETREIELKQGDRIILYTDGVTDATDEKGNRFGHADLLKLIAEGRDLSGDDLTKAIFDSVEDFTGGVRQRDDILVAVFELQDDPWIYKALRFAESGDVIAEILEALTPYELDKQELYAIRLATDESLANAWKHGVSQRNDAVFHLSYMISDEGFKLRVRDPGSGFDHESLPDPTVEENLVKPHGRGVFLIRQMMDEVEFNDAGNEITVFKGFEPRADQEKGVNDVLLLDDASELAKQKDSLSRAKESGQARKRRPSKVESQSAQDPASKPVR